MSTASPSNWPGQLLGWPGTSHGRPLPTRPEGNGITNSPQAVEQHWDLLYRKDPGHTGSWFQRTPSASMRLVDAVGPRLGHSVVDVGAGESRLVDRLLERGFDDLTALDISRTALETTRHRLGPTAARVHWLVQDVLAWRPHRRYDLWHDRAVFHFLTDNSARTAYLSVLDAALAADGRVVIGTFAPDGPDHCSGLPVARYSPEELAAQFDRRFRVLTTHREKHHTPAGAIQPFSWVALART